MNDLALWNMNVALNLGDMFQEDVASAFMNSGAHGYLDTFIKKLLEEIDIMLALRFVVIPAYVSWSIPPQ